MPFLLYNKNDFSIISIHLCKKSGYFTWREMYVFNLKLNFIRDL